MPYQGIGYETTVRLMDGSTPVTGILPGDVTVKIRKTGDILFTEKVMNADSWVELENGFYILRWNASDMSEIGSFFWSIAGAGFDFQAYEFQVSPYPVMPAMTPATCVVSGNMVDLGGTPEAFADIVFRPIKLPTEANGILITGRPIRTKPNAYGSFSVSLIRGMQAIVDIEWVGIKTQIIIPDAATANLIDLLPPIA